MTIKTTSLDTYRPAGPATTIEGLDGVKVLTDDCRALRVFVDVDGRTMMADVIGYTNDGWPVVADLDCG